MKRIHIQLVHCALVSLLGLWPGYVAATDVADKPAVSPSLGPSGIESRAIPSPLKTMVASLQLRLTQLESDARTTQAMLTQPGSNAPAIVSARFPQLAALARQTASEARAVRDQARLEQESQLEATADRIAADNDAIDRGMEEARTKAQQATQAATTQLLAGIIGSATQMKNAAGAMQGALLQNAAATPVQGGVVSGGAIVGAALGAPGTQSGAAVGGAYPGGTAGAGTGAGRLGIDQQVLALQQQVQALQAQMAALQSVLKIAPNGAVTILSPTSVTVQAGTGISIQSNGTTFLESKAGLDLRGSPIKLNGGTKPLATVGSQVQVPGQPIGLVTTGNQTILGP